MVHNHPAMQRLSRQQIVILVLLTLTWGLNWPMMKLGVNNFPALSFRALTVTLGLPMTNMGVWTICMILALRSLTSGRAAILAYTLPIFSAVIGSLLFATRL